RPLRSSARSVAGDWMTPPMRSPPTSPTPRTLCGESPKSANRASSSGTCSAGSARRPDPRHDSGLAHPGKEPREATNRKELSHMDPLIQLQATVKAPPGLTARTHRGVEFVVREVTWAAYPFGLAVTLMDPRTGSNTSL